MLTAVVPAGLYSKLTYNAQTMMYLKSPTPEGEVTEMAPTAEIPRRAGCYRKLWISFLMVVSVNRSLIPGTYERVDQNPQGRF
ncbi:MAG: hypothetical protein ACLUUO_20805 [Sellimonas intestinalis]